MDETAERLLASFAGAANKDLLHELDWRRFYKFTIYAHQMRDRAPVTEQEVTNWLFAHGFTNERAVALSGDFGRFCDLLRLYDEKSG